MPWNRRARPAAAGAVGALLTAAVLALLSGVAACSAAPGASGASGAESSPVRFSEDGRERTGRLAFRGGIVLHAGEASFGGLSDIRIGEDGTQFAAVSDSSAIILGRLRYDPAGRLTGAGDITIGPLNGADGMPLSGKQGDAEGLVRLPGGGWAVSLERDHRVLHYADGLGLGRPNRLDLPADVADLPGNGGLETMASLPDGRLLLIAEDGEDGVHPAWLGRSGQWSALRYRARPPFRPVGAAVLPGGDLLVLERRASLIGGWGSRIALVTATGLAQAAAAGGTVEGTEIGRIDPPMAIENYEGIDVRTSSDGRVMVYLVSDDNFQFTQRTIILMFELLAE